MNKTNLCCRLLHASGLLSVRAWLAGICRSRYLTILAYHRVSGEKPSNCAFDGEVISCTPEEFEREMCFVRRRFDVISFCDIIREGMDHYRNPLVITFDDGYRDNHDAALPVLLKYGLKATFFISTGFIETGQIPWWDEIAYLVRNSPRQELAFADSPLGCMSIMNEEQRKRTVSLLLNTAKTISDRQRRQMLGELQQQSVAPPVSLTKGLMMEWGHVRNLAERGMEIGSHTVSHPVLGNLEDKTLLLNELAESKIRLEREAGHPVDTLSYPVGGQNAVDDGVVEAAKKLGYRYGCLYEHGVNIIAEFDPFRLLRIKAEVGSDFNRFACKVLFPMLIRY